MELRQLEYFVAVAEERNFTRAAARVHVAQPGVSAQVRRLERELGQALLDRSGRTVRLTAVGAAVLPYARAALGAVAAARIAVDELTGLVRGHVGVGVITSVAADLPGMLAAFHAEHPAVEITLTEANSDELLAALRSGELDLAMVGLATPPPPGIATQVVADEALVAAVAHDHPLAGRTGIGVTGLREQRLISLPAAPGSARRSTRRAPARASGRASRSRRATRSCSPSSPQEGSAWRSCRPRSPPPVRTSCTRSRSAGRACVDGSSSRGGRTGRSAPPPGR